MTLDFHRGPADHGDVESLKDQEQLPKRGSAFRERLKREGVPILLEGYMRENPWTVEQVARDIWQNFFDANDFTADGIVVDLLNNPDGTVTVTVKGNSSYPFNRLAVIGAGFKSDRERSAGGKHEGSKILNLALLRDFGCAEVIYGSDDWEMRFYLDKPEEGVVDAEMGEQRMMYAKLTDRPKQRGSFCRFTTTPEVASSVVAGKDFFRHSENQDFEHPDIENDQVGCRVHPGVKGSFYLNGQRVSYLVKGEWGTVPGFTFWSKQTPKSGERELFLGRDRDVVNDHEFQYIFLNFFINSLNKSEAIELFALLDNYFEQKSYDPDREIGVFLLKKLCGRLAAFEKKFDFDDSWLAGDSDKAKCDMFAALGYRVCQPELAKVGMRSINDAMHEALDLQKVKPNRKEQARVGILESVMKGFFVAVGSGISSDTKIIQGKALEEQKKPLWEAKKISEISFKPIELFTRKGLLSGRFGVHEVMMARDGFREADPYSVISTYLHEVCHSVGTDDSAEFSYALTAVLRQWTKYLMEHPDALSDLCRVWNETSFLEWETFEEMSEDVSPLMSELEERMEFRREEAIGQIGLRAGRRVARKLSDIFGGQEFSLRELRTLIGRMDNFGWADYQQIERKIDVRGRALTMRDYDELWELEEDVFKRQNIVDAIRSNLRFVEKELDTTRRRKDRSLLELKKSQLESDLRDEYENLTEARHEFKQKRIAVGDPNYLIELKNLFRDFDYNGIGGIDFPEMTNPTYLLFAWMDIKNIAFTYPSAETSAEFGELLDFLKERSQDKTDYDFILLLGLRELLAAAESVDEKERYFPIIKQIYLRLTNV